MKLTFLHISDLHYQPDWPEEIQMVCRKFMEDVATQVARFENLYLVFSGDLVFAGEDAEVYSSFMEHFTTVLDKIGFPRERRICVPGNHDVSRSALKPLLSIQKGTLAEMKDERTFNDSLPQLSKTIFDSNFAHYIKCESSFAHHTCCASGLGGSGWEGAPSRGRLIRAHAPQGRVPSHREQ